MGGVIKNNGKSFITYTTTNAITFPLGAGVYIPYGNGKFTMEGGEISNNGNTGAPGSGIFVDGNVDDHDILVLNGPVTISNNTIAFLSGWDEYSAVKIGPRFSSDNNFAIDLCVMEGGATNDFITEWKDKQVIQALDNTVTIDAVLAAKFTAIKYYFTPTVPPSAESFPEFKGAITSDGIVSFSN
jgi:hypothetical protein